MKVTEITGLMERGGVYMLGEYRASKPETIKYRDKVTGKPAEFSVIKHVVETGNDQVTVQERSTAEAVAQFRQPFKKGAKVLLQCESFERVEGFLRATGNLFAVEA
ncbi:MAG: hypothetical protein HZA93_15025 [Verrucomicrobia bacterium]|nr:hypothetical protein [Verrucomicrobiota bacterium]